MRKFSRFAWFVLAFNIAVVLWGAYVRATGSGAGCGEHWPLCNGEVVPLAPSVKTMIEFTHRATSGLALIAVVAMAIWAFRIYPAKHAVRRAAVWAVAFMISEALVGAALVLLGHVAGNVSTNRGYSQSIHLTNTLFLLASLAITAWRSSEQQVSVAAPVAGRMRSVLIAVAGVFVLVGITGAIAALGNTLFHTGTLAEGLRSDFDPNSHPFVRLRILHPALAIALAGGLISAALYVVSGKRGSANARTLGFGLVWLTLVQVVIGALNLALMAPVWLQLVHLLSADLLWITLVLFALELRPAPNE